MPRKGAATGTVYVALLRAVNVGGTGKLPMDDLKRIAAECGFAHPHTWIASGNLLFVSSDEETTVRAKLEQALEAHMGRPVRVIVRTAAEMAQVARSNPFPDEKGSRHLVSFLPEPPPADTIASARGRNGERIALGQREIYIAYGDGIRHTRLKIAVMEAGTTRNMNTVEKLAELAGAIE